MSALVTTYLQDHHAGSVGGIELFERVAQGHGDLRVREAVTRIAEEVREDQAALERIMARCDAEPAMMKDLGAKVGEKVARLKPNERLTERSPLSDVIELEALMLGVHGKLLLWRALAQLGDPRLNGAELTALEDRASAQESELAELRQSQLHKLQQG